MAAGELGEIYYYDSDARQSGAVPARRQRDLGSRRPRPLDHRLLLPTKPVAVSASGVQPHPGQAGEHGVSDACSIRGHCVAHLNVNWLAPVKVRQTLIGGSRKMIVYDDLEPSEKIKVYDKGVTVTHEPEKIHRAAGLLPNRRHVGAATVGRRRRCSPRSSSSSTA